MISIHLTEEEVSQIIAALDALVRNGLVSDANGSIIAGAAKLAPLDEKLRKVLLIN